MSEVAFALEFKAPSEDLNNQLGSSVVGLPDLNADGRGEIAVGGIGLIPPGESEKVGGVIIFDGATGEVLRTLKSPNAEYLGYFGIAVATVSDISGDGIVDLAIGANREDPGTAPANAGRVYLFNLATGTLIRTLSSPNQATTSLFGESVAAVPDLNGDGIGELFVGAPGESPSGLQNAGRAYLFSGATGSLIRTFTTPNPVSGGNFGNSLGWTSDVNTDGAADLIIGAPVEGGGRAYIYSGSNGTLLRTLSSPNGGGKFGLSVVGISDLDGDGKGDLAVGAPQETAVPGGGGQGGHVYIYSGSTGGVLHTLYSPTPGTTDVRWFGQALARLPDIDGDGFDDLAVGATLEATVAPNNEAGVVHLFSGKLGTHLARIISPRTESGGQFGWALASVPDISGDGKADLVIGASTEDPSPSPGNAGRAYTFDPQTGNSIPALGPVTAQEILDYLLGITIFPGRLDVNLDGTVDVGDLVKVNR